LILYVADFYACNLNLHFIFFSFNRYFKAVENYINNFSTKNEKSIFGTLMRY